MNDGLQTLYVAETEKSYDFERIQTTVQPSSPSIGDGDDGPTFEGAWYGGRGPAHPTALGAVSHTKPYDDRVSIDDQSGSGSRSITTDRNIAQSYDPYINEEWRTTIPYDAEHWYKRDEPLQDQHPKYHTRRAKYKWLSKYNKGIRGDPNRQNRESVTDKIRTVRAVADQVRLDHAGVIEATNKLLKQFETRTVGSGFHNLKATLAIMWLCHDSYVNDLPFSYRKRPFDHANRRATCIIETDDFQRLMHHYDVDRNELINIKKKVKNRTNVDHVIDNVVL